MMGGRRVVNDRTEKPEESLPPEVLETRAPSPAGLSDSETSKTRSPSPLETAQEQQSPHKDRFTDPNSPPEVLETRAPSPVDFIQKKPDPTPRKPLTGKQVQYSRHHDQSPRQ